MTSVEPDVVCPNPVSELDRLRDAWRGKRFHYTNEIALHDALAAALAHEGIAFVREVAFPGGRDRIDFVVGRVGVEVKIKGSVDAVLRQVTRYAQQPDLDELLVVTTQPTHRALPREVGGKPVHVMTIGGLSL